MLRSDPEKVRAWQVRSRSNLPRTELAAGRKPIPARSPRKVERWQAVAEASVAALVAGGYRCAGIGLVPGGCAGPLDPHHLIPRSVRPDLAATVANIVPLCRQMHTYVTDHPAEAREWGLHGLSGDDLAELARIRAESALDRRLSASERFPR
jgi:hypothetical protein